MCDQNPETLPGVVREGAHPPPQNSPPLLLSATPRSCGAEDARDSQGMEGEEDNADEGNRHIDQTDQGLSGGLPRSE